MTTISQPKQEDMSIEDVDKHLEPTFVHHAREAIRGREKGDFNQSVMNTRVIPLASYMASRSVMRQEKVSAELLAISGEMKRQSDKMGKQTTWMLRLTIALAVFVIIQIVLTIIQIAKM